MTGRREVPRRNVPPLLVAIEGPSGIGKSTLTARAAAAFGWAALAEAYDRLDPPPDITVPTVSALARTERALLAEEGRRWRTAVALRNRGATVVADTGFLGPLTYTHGMVVLRTAPPALHTELVGRARAMAARGRWGLPDLILCLTSRTATRRLRTERDPARHPASLRERHEAVGRVEQRFYRQLRRRYPGRVRFLNAEGSVDAQVARLPRILRGVLPRRHPTADALRVLGHLGPPAVRTIRRGRRRRPVIVKKSTLPPRGPSR